MKQIITLALIGFSYIAQGQTDLRDSLTSDYLILSEITKTIIDDRIIYDISAQDGRGYYYTATDTLTDKSDEYQTQYIDSLVAILKADSTFAYNTANGFYNEFRKYTTQWKNAKNKIIKLLAVKP